MNTGHDAVSYLRTIQAMNGALRQYALEHDRLSEMEQMHRLVGNEEYAEQCHWGAVIALKAYVAEKDQPKERPR